MNVLTLDLTFFSEMRPKKKFKQEAVSRKTWKKGNNYFIVFLYKSAITDVYCFVLCPNHFSMGMWGSVAFSIIFVRMYIRILCTQNCFRVISFEYIGVLDSYFIHRYLYEIQVKLDLG